MNTRREGVVLVALLYGCGCSLNPIGEDPGVDDPMGSPAFGSGADDGSTAMSGEPSSHPVVPAGSAAPGIPTAGPGAPSVSNPGQPSPGPVATGLPADPTPSTANGGSPSVPMMPSAPGAGGVSFEPEPAPAPVPSERVDAGPDTPHPDANGDAGVDAGPPPDATGDGQ